MNAVQRRYLQIYKSSEWLLLAPESIGVGLRDFMISVKSKLPRCLRLAHCLCLFTSRPSALQTSMRGVRQHTTPLLCPSALQMSVRGVLRPATPPTCPSALQTARRGFVDSTHPATPLRYPNEREGCSYVILLASFVLLYVH